jgi:hypothetical protein
LLAVWLAIALPVKAGAETATVAPDAVAPTSFPVTPYSPFVTEASRRFAIPELLIRAVIEVESAGNAQAKSPRGALGLMQIMPESFLELSAAYDLGIDPFDPHDNIVAGTAYLRAMLDRFGSEGFLAAYNAGPHRYQVHLVTGRPLPKETRAYVAKLTSLFGIGRSELLHSAARRSIRWQQGGVFVEHSGRVFCGDRSAAAAHLAQPASLPSRRGSFALVPRTSSVFVRRKSEAQSR